MPVAIVNPLEMEKFRQTFIQITKLINFFEINKKLFHILSFINILNLPI